ncbi:hypothetical protein PGTUg99_012409 [Puccinia graminis f. sp. tritici]|uniref:Uncharacterized protein n=1 Tax=Puccinia graminis f. sp. tritici TaxID=56615 RepID=A0A5B0S9U3_PUCGR|nr:hypothetical protein PGTUg99_012409 [Puccinia graminis f. sp. tritici]
MVADNPPRISASASGYLPAGADGCFSAQTWRISGYPKGYPVPREATPLGGVPLNKLVYILFSSESGRAGTGSRAGPAEQAESEQPIDEAEPVPQSELSLNNPSMEAVKEAQTLCPGRRIDCLISLNGSGLIACACAKMGELSKRVARTVEARAAQEGWSASYFRASFKGLKNEDNQGEWESPDWVKAGTIKYLFIDARSQFD